MNDLNDMLIFAKVAELSGISPAARALRMPKSKVSRRMATLEEALGVRLLERSTRSVHLTEAGQIYYRHCKRIVEEANSARESLSQLLETPRGHLRINASVAIGQHLLGPHLGEFLAKYPEIELEVHLENRRVDLIAEGYDAVVRLGDLGDSALINTRLGGDRAALFAAPAYLARAGTPRILADLAGHRFLVMGDSPKYNQWVLVDGDGRQETVEVVPFAVLNDLTMIRQLAIDGGGIAMLPSYLSREPVRSGDLVRILSPWCSPTFWFYAVYPSHRGATLKLKAWLDFYRDKLMG
ncbi:LysR family transcriptional regulator [Sulfidibacter corallicola]|uniref:LysR family transcriptional regulator n=1 Tax=Sulfidibacter corallicola TaxID=2818388 RepID=A0A8A4TI18_SULCO|nr:LysR family transcriptional regulator [Sulfidibacter corallicola]QTD48834.1 LysR family transcriptional regulator [Sulfidibacter corallicola]